MCGRGVSGFKRRMCSCSTFELQRIEIHLTTAPGWAGVVQAGSKPSKVPHNLAGQAEMEQASKSGPHTAGRPATGWLESWTRLGARLYVAGRPATGWLRVGLLAARLRYLESGTLAGADNEQTQLHSGLMCIIVVTFPLRHVSNRPI